MASKIRCGFELNSTASGMEFTTATGTPAISSSEFNTGAYSGEISSLASGTIKAFNFNSNNAVGSFWKFHIKISTLPSAANTIATLCAGGATALRVGVLLNSNGTLTLIDEDGTIGTGSTALSTGAWHSLSVGVDESGGAGAHIVTLKVENATEVTASNRSISTQIGRLRLGGNIQNEAQTQGTWYFDDVCGNDSSGTVENSFPDYRSKLLYMRVDSAGDTTQWTPSAGSNFQCVDDSPTPNDGTDLVSSNTLNQIDEYNLAASGLSGVDIHQVCVFHRWQDNGSSPSRTMQRIKASSGGTVEESAAQNIAATWASNDPNALCILTLADLPGASSTAWSVTDLDAAQIGQKLSTAGSANTDVSAAWLIVCYVPAAAGGTILPQMMQHYYGA